MRKVSLRLDIAPKAKQLPFVFRGRSIKDAKTRKFELMFKEELRKIFKEEPFDSPIALTLTFGLLKPKSVKRSMPFVKPDLDNLIKSCDSGTGILWVDDALICSVKAKKIYAPEAFIEIIIEEMIE